MLRNCGNDELWSFNYKKTLQSKILFSCSEIIISVLRAQLKILLQYCMVVQCSYCLINVTFA